MSYAEVIADMCEIVLNKINPMRKQIASVKHKNKERQQSQTMPVDVIGAQLRSCTKINSLDTSNPAHTNTAQERNCKHKNPRYISAKLKAAVWQRDGGQCAYIDTKTGRRCTSKHLLQLDHDMPLFLGGETSQQNLRLLCHAHHRLRDQEFQ